MQEATDSWVVPIRNSGLVASMSSRPHGSSGVHLTMVVVVTFGIEAEQLG